MELCYLSAVELSRLIRKKEVSPVEVTAAHLARIEAIEPTLNSFITLLPEHALAAARKAETEIQAGGYRGGLHGIPVGLKDIYHVKGVRNTSGTRIFADFVPDYDSTIAFRFREAGAILLGKLNLHPMALGPTGENPDYGHMHNPWNLELIAGGSSGGSSSATSSGQCTVTMGTDTGGSVRIPSALCGIVGLKPTYGRLSRHGITPLSWSLDHPGPMARTVEDCGLVMNALVSYDPQDLTTLKVPPVNFAQRLNGNLSGLRVGVPKEYFEVPVDPHVEQAVRGAIDSLEELGATVTEVSWPGFHQSVAISTTILTAEAYAYHGKMSRDRGAQLYAPVRLRVEAGAFISLEDYLLAQRARSQFVAQSVELFADVDILAGPTVPITAHRIGDTEVAVGDRTVGSVAALTQHTRAFNLNGFPAISIPCGFSSDGLPIGLQLGGRPFDEATVLRTAYAYQQATEWHKRRPPL